MGAPWLWGQRSRRPMGWAGGLALWPSVPPSTRSRSEQVLVPQPGHSVPAAACLHPPLHPPSAAPECMAPPRPALQFLQPENAQALQIHIRWLMRSPWTLPVPLTCTVAVCSCPVPPSRALCCHPVALPCAITRCPTLTGTCQWHRGQLRVGAESNRGGGGHRVMAQSGCSTWVRSIGFGVWAQDDSTGRGKGWDAIGSQGDGTQ